MRAIIPAIRAQGVEVVFVGSGNAWQAAHFRQELGLETPPLDAPILVDPELTAFRAAEFRRGVTGVFSFGTLKSAVRAFRGGHRQRKVQGDAWQNGGLLLIAQGGMVVWRYASASAGDHPTNDAILAALGSPKLNP